MKELVILSGKGGTGKTTVAGALAHLWAGRSLFVDADVDAANLHLVTKPDNLMRAPFVGGKVAQVDASRCTECGVCTDLCRFDAIDDGRLETVSCEGCGLCAQACPEEAIAMIDRTNGEWFLGRTPYGLLLHAELFPGEGNSGKLVSLLREESRKVAAKEHIERIVVDGPPGIGCPVMASLAGAHGILAVAEPSASGLHDLKRVLDLGRHFEIPCAVALNRADVAPRLAAAVAAESAQRGVPLLAEIPYDTAVPECIAATVPVTTRPEAPAAVALRRLAATLDEFLGE